MIDVKEAVKKALAYLIDIIPDSDFIDPRLEEIESSDDGKNWFVTVSFIRRVPPVSDVERALGESLTPRERVYKIITIDAETGKPLSMKIRQLV
jgi:hypothetical protein